MDRHGRRRQPSMAVMLLVSELYRISQDQGVPPITLGTIAAQIAIFLRMIPIPWDSLDEVCLSVYHTVVRGKWLRVIAAQLEHGDEWHLYYNMLSFVWKGQTLEKKFGPRRFSLMLITFTILTGITYVVLNLILSEVSDDKHFYRKSCAVGFSGVIFALKVLTTHYWPNPGGVNVGGFLNVSSKYAVWAELVYIQLLTPNASFVGHLAGILVGIAYVKGPLSFLIDAVESIVFGDISRARPSRTTSGGYDQSRYRAGTTDYSHFFRNFFRNRAAGPGWRF